MRLHRAALRGLFCHVQWPALSFDVSVARGPTFQVRLLSTHIEHAAMQCRSWHLGNATKMLRETLSWRCTFKPHDIRWADVEKEGATGKQMIMQTVDTQGRPVVFMRPRLQNTHDHERQIKHLVYHLEHASRFADHKGE